MARPKKNNLDYFLHEKSMRNDSKIKHLRNKFGLVGYAIYNMILEYLCEKELLETKFDDFELELMADDFLISKKELIKLMSFFLNDRIALFQVENGVLRCKQLDLRAKSLFDYRKRDLNELREESENNNDSLDKCSLDKYSIDKETPSETHRKPPVKPPKKEGGSDFVVPEHLREVIELFKEHRKQFGVKHKLTPFRIKRLCNTAMRTYSDPNDQIEMFTQSIDREWIGIFPLVKYEKAQKQYGPQNFTAKELDAKSRSLMDRLI